MHEDGVHRARGVQHDDQRIGDDEAADPEGEHDGNRHNARGLLFELRNHHGQGIAQEDGDQGRPEGDEEGLLHHVHVSGVEDFRIVCEGKLVLDPPQWPLGEKTHENQQGHRKNDEKDGPDRDGATHDGIRQGLPPGMLLFFSRIFCQVLLPFHSRMTTASLGSQ